MEKEQHGEQQSKPYDFVKIEPLEPGDRQHPVGHERYHPKTVSGRLEATLIVVTPLHVASGRIQMREGQVPPLVKEMTRVDDQPCVQASTIKGTVRSVVEAITRSCIRITSSNKWEKYGVEYPEGTEGCEDPENLCLACRMFGSLGFEGHVRFGDAVLQDGMLEFADMPELWEPASEGADPYLDEGFPTGRKFYRHGEAVTCSETPVEVLAPESRLDFVVRFENLRPGELGVLLTGLGLGETELVLKIGGGKPVCYGSVLVSLSNLDVWENSAILYSDYEIEKEHQGWSADAYLQEAESLILPDQLQQLAEIWRYDPSSQCPEGNY
jgi:hypothetical protein